MSASVGRSSEDLPVEKGVAHLDGRDADSQVGTFVGNMIANDETSGLFHLGDRRSGFRFRSGTKATLPSEIPEAGIAVRITQLRRVDDQAGLGGLSRAHSDGNARCTHRDSLDLAGVKTGVDQPAPGSIKRFSTGKLMCQVSHAITAIPFK